MSAQNLSVKRESGKFYSDAFVHEASELYDWNEIETVFSKNVNATPYKCNDFFNFIFKSGLVSMNEYLEQVSSGKITKANAQQYWMDKLPLFEKLYLEKYVLLTVHPNITNAKQGNNSTQTGGANCNNLDFSNGTTGGWAGQWNNQNNAAGANVYGGLTVNGFNSSLTNRWGYVHELCTGGMDRNVPISTVPPGHSYSLRLGNDSAYQILQRTNNNPVNLPYNHQIISNTFMVTQQNKSISYWYAVVLCQYNPNNHASNIQPYFKIRLYDANGNEIMCAHYDVDALTAPNIGGFSTSSYSVWDPNQGTYIPYDFFYKPWSQVMIPLANYVGQNVTLTFETSDCAGGGHPGYAYIEADCSPMANINITPFACGSPGSTATLTAPSGAGSYSWAGPGIVGSNGNQTVTVNTAGSYTVTMTTLGNSGFNCTFTADTVIGPPPPAPVASFSATSACVTDPVQFTDLSSVSTGSITGWNWNFGDGHSSTSYNPTHIYGMGSGNSYVVNYTITTSAGCTASYSATVNLFQPPLPNFTSNTVCLGSPTSFTNTSMGSVNYTWNFGDGSPLSNATNPMHTYTSPGTYSVTLNNTSVNSCTSAVTIPVMVKPQPVASFNAQTTCLGNNTNFNNTSVYSGTGSFYWNFGDATTLADTSGLKNPTYTYPAAGVYTVTMALNSGTGCNANTTYTVLVSPLPSISVVQPLPYCPGSTVPSPVITNTPNVGITYNWTNNNTQIGLGASGNGVPPLFTAAQNSSFSNLNGVITITPYLNGCVGTPVTDTIKIQTAPLVVQPSIDLCPNMQSNPVNFTTIPNGIPATFNWTNTTPGNYIGLNPTSGTGSIPSFTTINPGANAQSISVSVFASYNGCDGPPATFSITDNPYPHASFTHSRACDGNQTQFADGSTVNNGGITQWNWDMNNDGIFNDASGPSPFYVFTPAGTHTVSLEVVSNKGCKNDTSEIIFVNSSPQVNIFGDVLSGCPVHTVNFTDSATVQAPQHIISYNWYFGNGTSWHGPGPIASSFTNITHNANAYYTISLQVVSDSGCIGSVQKTNYVTVYPIPKAAFAWGPTDADVLDPTIHFTDQSIGASGPKAITWYLGDNFAANDSDNYTHVQNPVHKYSELQPGTYHVTQWVENIYGCKDSTSDNVVIHPAFTFYAPNAFTPDGDNLNEGFKGTGIGIDNSTYKMWIYDRWGNLIFESRDLEKEWDGKVKGQPAQQDTYAWKVNFDDTTGRAHEYKGVVSLIR
ncbi:MAG TPA: PKD domain-containing protein [Bacteroidia bacterium]|jgi:gliding motility-associated-like protein|nr:PKD domain-containing protein [Bacteroidia bacterium]